VSRCSHLALPQHCLMMGSNLMVNKRLTGVPRPRCSSSLALIRG
jgi:hypothetical protein